MEDTVHFEDMLNEREIKLEWADRTVQQPDKVEDHNDGARHFIKQIPEFENRWLRVISEVIMTVRTKQVLEKAIHLPPVERAELVEQILSSFDFPSREEIDALWAKEAEDRINAYDQGKIKAIPASQVFEKINRHKS